MQEFLKIALVFAAGWWSHHLANRRDDRNRLRKAKDDFLGVLSGLESRIPQNSAPIHTWTELFHRESIIPLRDAVFTVRSYLSDASAKSLLDLWHSYEQESADARSALEARTAHELKHGAEAASMPPYPGDMLRSYMQHFRKTVTDAP